MYELHSHLLVHYSITQYKNPHLALSKFLIRSSFHRAIILHKFSHSPMNTYRILMVFHWHMYLNRLLHWETFHNLYHA